MEGRGREGRIHAAIQTNLKGGQEGKFGRTGARHLKMGRASGRAGRGGAARSARLGKGDHLGWSCGQAGAGPGLISGPCRFGPCSPCPNLEPVALFKLSGVALGHGVGSSRACHSSTHSAFGDEPPNPRVLPPSHQQHLRSPFLAYSAQIRPSLSLNFSSVQP